MLDPDKGSFLSAAVTDAAGRFEIRDATTAVSGLLVVRADGFREATRQFRAPLPDEVRVVLGRPVRTVVRLLDSDGRPLADGTVLAGGGAGPLVWSRDGTMATADVVALDPAGDGRYETDRLPPGLGTIVATHPGHRLRVVPSFAAGREADVVLEPSAGMRGVVTDGETHDPIPGVSIVLLPEAKLLDTTEPGERFAAHAGPESRAVSDTSGAFAFTVSGAGDRVLVVAEAPGYWRHWAVREVTEEPLALWLTKRGRAAVEGRVVAADGGPIAGALVRHPDGAVATDDDGRFAIADAPAHTPLTVTAEGFLRQVVTVAPDAPPSEIELIRAVTVAGRVVDGEGAPVSGLMLGFLPLRRLRLPPETISPSAAWTDEDGRVRIDLVAGEEFRVEPVRKRLHAGSATFRAVADGEHAFVLSVDRRPAGGIRGRVRVTPGDPAPVAVFLTVTGPGPGPTAWAAPDGSFAFEDLPADDWCVSASAVLRPGEPLTRFGEARATVRDRETTDVVIAREPPAADPPSAVFRVRVEMGGRTEDPSGLAGFATAGDRTARLRAEGDLLTAEVPAGADVALWIPDAERGRAVVVANAGPARAAPREVPLYRAGTVLVPPGGAGAARLLRIRAPGGATIFAGRETSLPAAAGGRVAVLPAGLYEFRWIGAAAADDGDPRPAEVKAGATTTLE